MRRRSTSRRKGKAGTPPPRDPSAPPAPPADPLAHLSPEHRAFAIEKKALEARLAANPSADMALEDLVLCLPGFDPRLQAGDCYFDREAAERVIGFFHDCLVHIEGEWMGQPFLLQPWQRAIVANLFGWKRPDGMRRFRELFLEVPRKNGKSPLAAGIVLYLLVADGEPGAQIYGAAGDKGQAGLIFRWAHEMVLAKPGLRARIKAYVALKSLEYRALGSFYRAISKESKTKHGYNAHGVVVDELHVQQDSRLVDTLTSSTGTRRQPMVVYITTADWARQSICNEKEGYAEKVAANLIHDPEFLPVIYRAPKGAPWDQEATWRIANPNLGVAIKLDEIAREARKARVSPRVRNEFLRLRLNVKTQAEVAWIPDELWAACGAPPILDGNVDAWIDELDLEGALCYGGLDLGATRDLTAFVLYFPPTETRAKGACLSWFWAPRERAEIRDQTEGVSYTAWASEGWIELTPGRATRWGALRPRIAELGERFRIQKIMYDRWAAKSLADDLEGDGFEMEKFGQGFQSMSAPSKELEAMFLDGRLLHGGNPVLAWNAGNVMVVSDDAGNIKPSKKRSPERIDGIVALVMAIGGAQAGDENAYDDGEGLRRL